MKKFLILGIVAVALTACTDVKVPFMSSAKTESSSSSSTSVFASLKEQLNGREFGDYQVSGGKLVFGEFGLTRMGGSQDEMTKELQFLDLLKNNKSVKLSGGTLTLISNEGIELVFKDPKAVNTEAK